MRLNVLLFALVGILVTACSQERDEPMRDLARSRTQEVLPRVYDTQRGTAYLRVDEVRKNRSDESIADLIAKKKQWQQANPNKRIVAMTIATGNAGDYGYPAPIGLLIDYERR